MTSSAEAVQIFIDAWKLMVGRLPGGVIEQSAGVSSMFGHVPLPFFNFSMLDGPLADEGSLRDALALVNQRAAACEHASMSALCVDWVPQGWERVAAAAGLTPIMNLTAMEAGALMPPRRPAPAMEIRRVADDATARDMAMVNAQAYGMPGELFECICNLQLWHDDSFGYVGYADGRAVSTAAAFPVAGTVYVALVATLPEAQGKGYADAVMRHAVEQGQQAMGFARVTLHASDMGQPVYRAMGFAPGARLVGLAAGH